MELLHLLGLCPDHMGNFYNIVYYLSVFMTQPTIMVQGVWFWIKDISSKDWIHE